MKIWFKDQYRKIRIRSRALIRLVGRVLAEMGEDKAEVGLILTGDAEIRRLNRHYRGIDWATDVLAFAMNEPVSACLRRVPSDGLVRLRRSGGHLPAARLPDWQGRQVGGFARGGPHGPPEIKVRSITRHQSPDGVDTYPHLLGDVVISMEAVKRQARQRGHSVEREMAVLIIHGLLHLLGYDHERSLTRARAMRRKEKELLEMISDKF